MNILGQLENAEDGEVLKRIDVLKELHRLAHRQFEWQHGFLSVSQLYRSAFIYGGEKTNKFFYSRNKFTIDDFTLGCFALREAFSRTPYINSNYDMNEIGISKETSSAILKLITLPLDLARSRANILRAGLGHISYKKSLFRETPCASFGTNNERICAPLPDLISLRASTGLFYDVINGGGDVKNEISFRFEKYCLDYLSAMLVTLEVNQSFKYQRRKGAVVDSPDILVSTNDGPISFILECKARRLSYEAKFSEDPVLEAKQAYEEIAKGILQIWRFVSDVRQKIVSEKTLSYNAKGIVLTLDTWMSYSSIVQEEAFKLAETQAVQSLDIILEDRIPVVFCSIEELEFTLNDASLESFLLTLEEAATSKYLGWALSGVHRDVAPEIKLNNPYPFKDRLAEILPWWDKWKP